MYNSLVSLENTGSLDIDRNLHKAFSEIEN